MRRDTVFRRATIWLATVGYALVVSGLPLPLGGMQPASPMSAAAKRLAGKDRSRPFPCQDKPCGCATAEHCFANCCCNTPAELLAWAKARRVEPGLIAALVRRARAELPKAEACCSAARPACCAGDAAAAEAADSACGESSAVVTQAAAADEVPRGISLRAMRGCRGLAAEWVLLGVAIPPVPAGPIGPAAACTDRPCLVDVSAFGALPAPDGPPPRGA